MNNRFFASLAVRNMKANCKLFVPYAIAAILLFMMFYLMAALMTNEFVQQRHSTLPMLFAYGVVVIAVFSVIFMLYTNSFLIKRRKQEMGLYGILGLERRHVAAILAFETFFSWVLTIGAGWLLAQLFGRLLFMLLNYLLGLPEDIPYSSSIETAGIAVALFVGIYLLAYLYNLTQLTAAQPIRLLRGKKEGEKEPRGSWILFIIGSALLGWGYWISVTIADPLSAISRFFGAVFLVIIGTYLIYMAGSIVILKALRKNKSFYYRPGPFISISGMLYRMKQNAVGLANICILSTMVIISVSTTVTLYLGTEETLTNRFPYENSVMITGENTEEDVDVALEQARQVVTNTLGANELEATTLASYTNQTFIGRVEGDTVSFVERYELGQEVVFIYTATAEDYEAMTGSRISIEEGEVLYHYSEDDTLPSQLTVGDMTYTPRATEPPFATELALASSLVLIFSSEEEINQLREVYTSTYPDAYLEEKAGTIGINTTGSDEEKQAFARELRTTIQQVEGARYESRELQRQEWYSMNGGFLFLGIFLGFLFVVGTVLITYFKQISEGFDDREKFQIMQHVGLDEQMIRSSTRMQLIWMFLLPLVTAIIHVSFAYPIVQKLLMVFGILSDRTWIFSFTGVVLSFAVIYFLIYTLTSRIYYQLVK